MFVNTFFEKILTLTVLSMCDKIYLYEKGDIFMKDYKKTINFYFQKHHLGEMIKLNRRSYVYMSDISGEESAIAEHLIVDGYNLFNSDSKYLNELPDFCLRIIDELSYRPDITEKFPISVYEDSFDILFDYSRMEQEQTGLHFFGRNMSTLPCVVENNEQRNI